MTSTSMSSNFVPLAIVEFDQTIYHVNVTIDNVFECSAFIRRIVEISLPNVFHFIDMLLFL